MNTTHIKFNRISGNRRFRLVFILVGAALWFGFTIEAIAADAISQNSNSVLTVNVVSPQLRKWRVAVPTSGWFAPWHEAVIASGVDGLKITEIHADVGDVVQKGQVLALLEQEAVIAELRRLEASMAAAKAEYAMAKANADRSRRMRGTGAQATQQYEEFICAEKSAAAALVMAQAGLDVQRIKLEQTKILAIDDGVISSRSAALGTVVSTGTELFRLIRQQRVEWQAEVDSRYMLSIRKGQQVLINMPDGDVITGRVRAVAPDASKNTSRAIAYVSVDPSADPKAGMYAGGSIALDSTPALTVPESAIVLHDGLNYVFTLQPDSRVSRVRVETGRRQDGRVEIRKGLDARAKVVRSGGAFLFEGAFVTVLAQTEEEAQ